MCVICNEVKYNSYQIERNEIDWSLLDARWHVDVLANPTLHDLDWYLCYVLVQAYALKERCCDLTSA
jgi:hypothetical protein